MLTFFGVERGRDDPSADVWPTGIAPFLRLHESGSGNRIVVDDGIFGLLPDFAVELAYGRKTYNARSETVHRLASFRTAWAKGQRCIIPAEFVCEPCYESGQAVRWKLAQPGAIPFGIAGIYTRWRGPEGQEMFTFAMLTVNADDHPVWSRMHKPGDEKRMPVILDREDYGQWLACPVDAAAKFLRQWPGPVEASPAPLPVRAPRATSGRTIVPPEPDEPQLF